METRTDKNWTVLDGNDPAPFFTGVNTYGDCVPDEEALKESREKNRALVASLGEEFEDLRNLLKV